MNSMGNDMMVSNANKYMTSIELAIEWDNTNTNSSIGNKSIIVQQENMN